MYNNYLLLLLIYSWDLDYYSIWLTGRMSSTKKKRTNRKKKRRRILMKKVEYKPPAKEAQNEIDYEKKYNEKNKDLIESQKEIAKAVAGIKDEEEKVKKTLELTRLKQAEKFLGKEQQNNNISLSLEKDFIELAQQNAARINDAQRPSQFTFSYLKNSIELLAPSLDSDRINDLIKAITVVFNKKLKEEGTGSKSKSKKPNINTGKAIDRNDKKGIIQEYGGRDDYEEEEYEDDDFM